MKKITHTTAQFLLLLTFIAGMVLVWGEYDYLNKQLPNISTLRHIRLQVPLRIYAKGHVLIGIFGNKRRLPVALKHIPHTLIQALIATEDARFYEDPGVDVIGILRAAKAVILSGKKVQGASTITMQVARNFFLSPKKTYLRKINEILLALKIDRHFSKQNILWLYLNKIYLGEGAYGVLAAAHVYYGKNLNELTLAQLAMIAGLPQAPSANNPIANPAAAIYRRNHVLQRMLNLGYLKQAAFIAAKNAPDTARYHGEHLSFRAPYFTQMVRQYMLNHYGPHALTDGYSVFTTLSPSLEYAAQQALTSGLLTYDKQHGYHPTHIFLGTQHIAGIKHALRHYPTIANRVAADVLQETPKTLTAMLANGQTVTIPWSGLFWAREQLPSGRFTPAPTSTQDIVLPGNLIWITKTALGTWYLSQLPKVQGALVSLNPDNGAILALCGGFNFTLSRFNRATQAHRQPGSAFKPFIYSAALNKGDTLATLIDDTPLVSKNGGENAWWRPENDNDTFNGPTRLSVGLIQSRNLVSIRLLQSIGIPYALTYLKRFGFNANTLPHSLSLALGTALLTPLQLATAYSVFANGGYHVPSHFIRFIKNEVGHIVYQANFPSVCNTCTYKAPRAISAQNAFLITHAMQGVIQSGTGQRAKILHRTDLAGKTGTTNLQHDAWFSGFNSHIETTVWVGYDNMQSTFAYGSQVALPIWIQFMKKALAGKPLASMPIPTNIVSVRIDPNTGLLANPANPNGMFEYFRSQYVPSEYAPRHTVAHNNTFSNTTAAQEIF